MNPIPILFLCLMFAGLFPAAARSADAPLELIRATFFGGAGNDDIQGGCAAPDGTICIAGNMGAPLANLPGGIAPSRLGADAANPRCGHGFVARLSADGGKLSAYTEFGKGILSLTTVQANAQGVYVAGYATDALEPLLKDLPGLMREYPLRKEVELLEQGKWLEAVGENPAKPDPIQEAKHGQLGRYGAPCVLRLSADLKKIECGTYLEGWQQVWGKDRVLFEKPKGAAKQWKCWPTEHSWYPTHAAMLKDGDLIVCHDGGYFRVLTDAERRFAVENAERLVRENPNPPPEKPGQPVPDKAARLEAYRLGLLKRLGFYDVCDYLSRLSPDLSRRVWRRPVYTPATDRETARIIKDGWPLPHVSNPRTAGLVLGKDDKIYVWGWSASITSQEPWWSPFIWELYSNNGCLIRKIQETDPMSGGGNRMSGAVADKSIGGMTLEEGGTLVSNSLSDGGFSGVCHFSGSIWRLDLKSREFTESTKTRPCVWATALAALPKKHLLAIGRCNFSGVQWTQHAWQKGDPEENPEAWLRVYNSALEIGFSTAIRGVKPYAIAPLSETRFLIAGTSWGILQKPALEEDKSVKIVEEPNPGVAVVKNPLFDKQQGKSDGYFMIVEWKAEP